MLPPRRGTLTADQVRAELMALSDLFEQSPRRSEVLISAGSPAGGGYCVLDIFPDQDVDDVVILTRQRNVICLEAAQDTDLPVLTMNPVSLDAYLVGKSRRVRLKISVANDLLHGRA